MPKGNEEVLPDTATATLLARGPAELEALCERMGRPVHGQKVRQHGRHYRSALLAPVPRKNGWQVAQQAGQARPHGLQRVLMGRPGTQTGYVTIYRRMSRNTWAIPTRC